jgi:hypothetical protein
MVNSLLYIAGLFDDFNPAFSGGDNSGSGLLLQLACASALP